MKKPDDYYQNKCKECDHTREEHWEGRWSLNCGQPNCDCDQFIEANGKPSGILNP